MSEAPDHLWIWFADRDEGQPLHIRQWQSTPFGDGTEYVRALSISSRSGEAEAVCDAFDVLSLSEAYGGSGATSVSSKDLNALERAVKTLRASIARETTGEATAWQQLREAYEAAKYVPGDCPVMPYKAAAFVRTVGDLLSSTTPQEPVPAPEEKLRRELIERGIDGDIMTLVLEVWPDADARQRSKIHCRVLDALATTDQEPAA
jgi:hypothetical protein